MPCVEGTANGSSPIQRTRILQPVISVLKLSTKKFEELPLLTRGPASELCSHRGLFVLLSGTLNPTPGSSHYCLSLSNEKSLVPYTSDLFSRATVLE